MKKMDYKIQNFHNYFSNWRFKSILINKFLIKQDVNLNDLFSTQKENDCFIENKNQKLEKCSFFNCRKINKLQ